MFATDTTDVILDINGYFIAGSNVAALAFYSLTPCRVADTRDATAPLGGPSLAARSIRSFPIQASRCGVPAAAQAYSLNFAAVPKSPTLGFLTAWPAGQSQPLVASLNDPTGTILANAVVVPAGTGGAVNVFTTDNTDLVIDIDGFFAPEGPGGLSVHGAALSGVGFAAANGNAAIQHNSGHQRHGKSMRRTRQGSGLRVQRHRGSTRPFGLHHHVAAGADTAASGDAECH